MLTGFLSRNDQSAQFPRVQQCQSVHGPGAGDVQQTAVVICRIGFLIRIHYNHFIKLQSLCHLNRSNRHPLFKLPTVWGKQMHMTGFAQFLMEFLGVCVGLANDAQGTPILFSGKMVRTAFHLRKLFRFVFAGNNLHFVEMCIRDRTSSIV